MLIATRRRVKAAIRTEIPAKTYFVSGYFTAGVTIASIAGRLLPRAVRNRGIEILQAQVIDIGSVGEIQASLSGLVLLIF